MWCRYIALGLRLNPAVRATRMCARAAAGRYLAARAQLAHIENEQHCVLGTAERKAIEKVRVYDLCANTQATACDILHAGALHHHRRCQPGSPCMLHAQPAHTATRVTCLHVPPKNCETRDPLPVGCGALAH